MRTESDDQLLNEVSQAIFQRAEASLSLLSWPEQVVAIVYSAQGIMDNGGLWYFFESDWPENPPYSLFADAYRAIGADVAADCIERAAALFPISNPHLDLAGRLACLGTWRSAEDSAFAHLDDIMLGEGDDVFSKPTAYVREHPTAFSLPGEAPE